MKTILRSLFYVVLLAAFCSAPVLAATELAITGQGVNLKDGPTVYEVAGEALFGIGKKDYVVVGPSVVLSDDDTLTRAGVGLEWNLTSGKGGLFVGATGHYFLDEVEGLDNWTATGRAGLKFPVGQGALLKVFLSQPIGGRFNDIADIAGNVGISAKF